MRKEEFDPQVYEFYRQALEGAGFRADLNDIDIDLLRRNEISGHLAHFDPYDPCRRKDYEIPREDMSSLRIRVYVPESLTTEEMPVILFFHGGGFIMGSIDDHDPLCCKLAYECRAVVIAPEYRLAPEHPFPACINDAVLTAEWAREHARDFKGDPGRILAGGDSSGANISAVLALLARDGAAPEISGLLLFYGIYGCISPSESESGRLYGQGEYVLPVNVIEKMMELYIPADADTTDYRISPGMAGNLSSMPPTIIVSGELDPLRDDGVEFAGRLEAAGNKVCSVMAHGMMHGFMLYWQRFRRAQHILEQIGSMVRDGFM